MSVTWGTLQVGSLRSDRHEVEDIQPTFHLRGNTDKADGIISIVTKRGDKCAWLRLTPEGVMELIARLLGALPLGVTPSEKLMNYFRMFLIRDDKISYVVQKSYEDIEEAYRGWSEVWGIFPKREMARAAIEAHEQSSLVMPHEIFRIVERRERVIVDQ